MRKKFNLSDNWVFKIDDNIEGYDKFKEWMKCEVPGTGHIDLLNLGLIEDPIFALK